MAFDPSIISKIPSYGPNPMVAAEQAYKLKDMIDEGQVRDLQLNQLKRQEDEENAQREILKSTDLSKPQGWMDASQKLAKAGFPDAAIAMQRQYQNMVSSGLKIDQTKQSLQLGQVKLLNAFANTIGPAAVTIKQTLQTKGFAMAQAQYQQMLPQILQGLPPEIASRLPRTPPQDPQQFSALLDRAIAGSQEAQNMLKQQQGAEKLDLARRHENAYEENVNSQEKSRQVDPSTVEDTARMIATGKMPMLSGFVLKTPWGQAVVARVSQLNPNYNYATATTRAAALKAFSSGTQGNTVRSLNVAINHMDTLSSLATALQNKDTLALNKAANLWKTQTGQPAPTNFTAARNIVANEVVKAITASGGTLADREEAQKQITAAASPAQLAGVIDNWKRLLAGQLSGLRQQYEQGTGQKDFDRFLSPQVKAQLESISGDSAPTPSNAPTATGPNGQKLILQNGQWVPLGR